MTFRTMLVALVLVTAGCSGRIKIRSENPEQAKIKKAILLTESLAAKSKNRHDPEECIDLLLNVRSQRRVEIKPRGCGFIHITRDELPAPHPIDLPETHPKDLPEAEPCPSHPKDLPVGEARFITFKSIGVYQVQYAYHVYVPGTAYQYLPTPAYVEYGKPPTVNETTGVKTYYPAAPGILEAGTIKAVINNPPERLTGRIDPELELKLNTVYERLMKHVNDSVDDKLMLLHQRDQIRDLEFEVRTLKLLVGELIKRKQVP